MVGDIYLNSLCPPFFKYLLSALFWKIAIVKIRIVCGTLCAVSSRESPYISCGTLCAVSSRQSNRQKVYFFQKKIPWPISFRVFRKVIMQNNFELIRKNFLTLSRHFTSSILALETIEKCVKYVQSNSRLPSGVFAVQFEHILHLFLAPLLRTLSEQNICWARIKMCLFLVGTWPKLNEHKNFIRCSRCYLNVLKFIVASVITAFEFWRMIIRA